MFELNCLTNRVSLEQNSMCFPHSWGGCEPAESCGPDYGVSCMPQCDPADDE